MRRQKFWWLLTMVMLVLSVTLVACGGGGSSSSTSDDSDSSSTGSVAVLVTDAPSEDFAAIEVTVTAVSLIDDEENLVVVWSSDVGKTIDLLALETESELFTLATDVPVGWYDKVRLTIDRVALVDDVGEVTEVSLPASGKIDLNPRGRFYVSADETLTVQLDIDANKSIHLLNANHYVLRPVVFVDILTAADAGRLVRLPGTVLSVDAANNQFVLQEISMSSQVDGDDTEDDSLVVSLGDSGVIFGADGLPMALTDLTPETAVVAVGFFAQSSDDGAAQFDAVVVEVGDYTKVRGTLLAEPGADGTTLLLSVDAATSEITLDAATVFYDCFGAAITRDDLALGQKVAVDAVAVGDTLIAALVVTCPDDTDNLSGTLSGITDTSLQVGADPGQCAEEGESVAYYRLSDDTLTEITRDDLALDDTVLLFGTVPDVEGECFIYDQLFILE